MTALAIGAPQIIWISLAAMGVGISIVKHGEPRSPHSMWASIIGTPLAVALLYWGGFFTA
jgi:2-keto-4-pentenoate hydratase